MAYVAKPIEQRFWPKVRRGLDNECWEWTGSDKGNGYGQVLCRGRVQSAHRVAFEIANGPIPSGLFVCHRCDNKRCCNPSHLFLGTPSDNVNDMHAKGRANHVRKLSVDDVLWIRWAKQYAGCTGHALGRAFGIHAHHANAVAAGACCRTIVRKNRRWRGEQ